MNKLSLLRILSTIFLFLAATTVSLSAQTFTLLHSFIQTDGGGPYGALVQAPNGNLYGTTSGDGANFGGTVFAITPSGTLTTLYNFCSQTGCADGSQPLDGLSLGADGNFYGTTYGNALDRMCSGFCGTLFRISANGAMTTLYSFCSQSNCADGANPAAHPIANSNGDLYGTTFYGGTNNSGTIYKLTQSGTLTTLYSFCSLSGCVDGQFPNGALVLASDGNLYGTTYEGGSSGLGTVFKITPEGTLTTLYSFCTEGGGCVESGELPVAALVEGNDGNFYGLTSQGGAAGDDGTLFTITPDGTLTTLHSFCSLANCADGRGTSTALVQATDGNFYGTAPYGGVHDDGTIFRLTPTGVFNTIHAFDGSDGSYIAGLVQYTNGDLYGLATSGGPDQAGTVYSLAVGQRPFVEALPNSAAVGSTVRILGTRLTAATSVTFNGIPATFTIVSPTLITTTVPAGATTGFVQVTKPRGTLTSNAVFRVQ